MRELTYTSSKPQRLDAFLLAAFPALTPGVLHKALRQNKIKLNGKKQPLSTRLAQGDLVRLFLPDEAFEAPCTLTVVWEDERLLVADKPAGLPTLAPEGADSLLARAALRARQKGEAPPLPCHRLDTGTSGLVLMAKDEGMLAFIEGLLHSHQLQKQYVCVVLGQPKPAEAVLHGWHTKDAKVGKVLVTTGRRGGAKPVETRYKTLVAGEALALLEVGLVTGRTHQIRAHLASVGHPVLGDSRYGQLAANRQYRCRYQCLCALRLAFPPVHQPEFAAYSGLTLEAAPPWYYTQMLEGTLL